MELVLTPAMVDQIADDGGLDQLPDLAALSDLELVACLKRRETLRLLAMGAFYQRHELIFAQAAERGSKEKAVSSLIGDAEAVEQWLVHTFLSQTAITFEPNTEAEVGQRLANQLDALLHDVASRPLPTPPISCHQTEFERAVAAYQAAGGVIEANFPPNDPTDSAFQDVLDYIQIEAPAGIATAARLSRFLARLSISMETRAVQPV
jgi:hypothetical protein